jgi:hypothetical protein
MATCEYKVLITYTRPNGVIVSRSLYTGPHKKYADKAYLEACTLASHGILVDCMIEFFDGHKLRVDWNQDANARHASAERHNNMTVDQLRAK